MKCLMQLVLMVCLAAMPLAATAAVEFSAGPGVDPYVQRITQDALERTEAYFREKYGVELKKSVKVRMLANPESFRQALIEDDAKIYQYPILR